jgi:hypothetical protein
MTEGRYDKLKTLLPPVDSPYSVDNLSAAETAVLDHSTIGSLLAVITEIAFPLRILMSTRSSPDTSAPPSGEPRIDLRSAVKAVVSDL